MAADPKDYKTGTELRITDLGAADIIATAGTNVVGRTIRGWSGSKYQHLALYSGSGMAIDAQGDGVKYRELYPSTEGDPHVLGNIGNHVFRAYGAYGRSIQILRFAQAKLGVNYDMMGAARSLFHEERSRAGTFCSMFVIDAYMSIGLFNPPLSKDKAYPPSIIEALLIDQKVCLIGWLPPTKLT